MKNQVILVHHPRLSSPHSVVHIHLYYKVATVTWLAIETLAHSYSFQLTICEADFT